MPDRSAELLTAVQNLLKANAPVAALVEDRVYGSIPQAPTYPYVRLSDNAIPWSTQTFSGMKHTLRVQAFSQDSKPGVPLAIRAACFDALDRQEDSLAVEGLVSVDFDGMADAFVQEDGKTYQAVIEFSVLIQ